MASYMTNTFDMQSRVYSAIHGELDESQQTALVEEVIGAFSGYPVIGNKMVKLARDRQWNGLYGALGNYIDVEGNASKQTTVIAQSNSNAVASVNIDLTIMIDIQKAIYESDELSEDDRAELVRLMREIVEAAQNKEHQKVGERLREWLSTAADFATVMQTIGPLLTLIGTLLGGSAGQAS